LATAILTKLHARKINKNESRAKVVTENNNPVSMLNFLGPREKDCKENEEPTNERKQTIGS